MSKTILDSVVQALQDGGIPAQLAYPGRKLPALTECCAAVCFKQVDRNAEKAEVLVMVLAPFMKSAPPVENAIPDHSPAPIVQTAELDSVVTEFTLYNEIPDIALRSNQRQQSNTSVDICDVCLKIPLPTDSLQGKYYTDFILNYPAEYLANSQPSRAAPYLI